jgi:archaellum component FlaF (FlaF/FlaG flagellin family)
MLPDTVHCDMSYMVIATVLNQGDTTESFDMGVTIDTMGIVVYADTQQVLGLLASAETTIGFSPLWSVPVRDSVLYNVLVYTMLASDDSTANDTLQKNVYSYCYWIRDAGPVTVLSPGDTVHSDSTYQVQANVSNFGEVVESLDVECIITPGGYVDTQTVVGLSPGDTAVVSFTDWVAPAGDSTVYTMRVVTLLGVDAVHSNDSLSKNIFAYWLPQHDCGITAITSPPDTIFVGVKYAPVAVAHNWGNYTETFDAICTIDGYVDTQTVYSLAPQWSAMVVFDSFSTASAGSYTMNVRTALAGDLRAGNDTAFKTLEAVAGFSENLALPRTPASRLLQNAPNPFSRYTNIYCQIAEPGTIRLNVYNLAGRLVKVIFDGFAEPGCYSSIWQGDDETGNPVPSGVYIYKLTAGDFEASRKLVLVR